MMNDLLNQCHIFYKVARRQDDLDILHANIGKYIHFSNSDRFGISYHKDIHPGNPRGLYGFRLTEILFKQITNNKVSSDIEEFGWNKYIYIFDVGGKIFDMDNINYPTVAKQIKDFAAPKYGPNYYLMFAPSNDAYPRGAPFPQWLHNVINDYQNTGVLKNEHSAVNILMRGIGYDAMETKNYGFGDDLRAEICVLNPSSIHLITRTINPMLSTKELNQMRYILSPKGVEEERVRQKQREDERLVKQKEREDDIARRIKDLDEERAKYDKEHNEFLERMEKRKYQRSP